MLVPSPSNTVYFHIPNLKKLVSTAPVICVSHSSKRQIPWDKWNEEERPTKLILLRVFNLSLDTIETIQLTILEIYFDGKCETLGIVTFEFIVILPFTNYEILAI